MTPILGVLYPLADGRYQGVLRALLMNTQIELRPTLEANGHRAFEVYAGPEFQAGVAHQPIQPPDAPISITLNSPDLPQAIKALAAPRGDGWSIQWLLDD